MFSAIARVFKTPDLRRKIWFTIAIIAIYRIGAFIPAPGVDYSAVQQCLALGTTEGGLYSFVNMFSGGALLQVSIFALGIMPYITAAIIVQLLRVVIPRFENLQREGPQGQSKLTQYTRYLTIALALLNATTLVSMVRTGALLGCDIPIITEDVLPVVLLMILSLVTGVALIMWLGEQITERGVGNGMSILIFVSIAAGFPGAMGEIWTTQGWRTFGTVMLIGLVTIAAVVFVEQSQRRVPVQYAKRQVGRRTVGGTSTYIPIKVNMAGVIPVIFASSVLMLPSVLAQFNQPGPGEEPSAFIQFIQTYFVGGTHPLYMAAFFLMTIFFTYFYVTITFNPNEVAENMRKFGGFIPGIRAGKPTESYLAYVISRITFPGALYLGLIALIPLIAFVLIGANQNFPFGGTSILIMVGVGLTTVKQINAQMEQRNYEGLLR
ncbi:MULTISPECIES: preprotein translocase subunit SecY [Nesterenkonia]|uniref:Protein translocase subunit SecY n=2 Tax=Nesterenkonia TaxID=57494 RepID=A0A0W8IKN5_9MICC|nr:MULTISPECIES: preprotein translocase subunit SecY [Nesterenkonia]KUG60537.1 preprotein translocase subunit SecY [Nesterenkonia jeotgali]MBA8922632.1 preprotein translocase subunit SecY [Nesterenkonia jeotgali]NYJ15890.1 preprotein translocase subunit SecY [Nesterenkonia sandarakina]